MTRIFLSLLGGSSLYLVLSAFFPLRLPVQRTGRASAYDVTKKGKTYSFRSRRTALFVLPFVVFLMLRFSPSTWLMMPAAPAAAYVLRTTAERRRRSKMEEQLPDALALIGNAMSAGFSLVQALSMVGREIADPLGRVFRGIVSGLNLGVDVDAALANAAKEVRSEDFEIVAAAISIQRTTGGNLPRILEIVATTVRQKQQLAGKLKSLTAQGKMTAVIVALLPVIMLVVMKNLMPSYVAPLFEEPIGRALLVVAGTLEVVGLGMIRRITSMSF